MASITTATLVAKLYADTSAFVAQMRTAGQSAMLAGAEITATGEKVAATGKSFVKAFAPLALIGGLAVKAALDYNAAIGKIRRLTTQTTDDVDMMSNAIMKISVATGKGPKELADAMYLLASSGLSAKAAVSALDMSAQASAIGLGETKTIADAVSSAMNAYSREHLSARDATNALINAVKMGKLPPEELAGQLGKVMSMAEAAGISFQEVTADIASLTQVGVPAAVATTALRSTIMSLAKPSKDAEAAFAGLWQNGIAGFRESVREKGLLPSLQELSDKVNGNQAAMTALFPEARALTGILAWTGGNAKNSAANFEELQKNTDSLAKGMADLAGRPGFQMKQAFAQIQVALVKLGDSIMPVVGKFASGIGNLVAALSSIPKPLLEIVGGFIAWGVTTGLMLSTVGKLITMAGKMLTAMLELATGTMAAASMMNLAMGVISLLVIGYMMLTKGSKENKTEVDALTEAYRIQMGVINEAAATSLYKTIVDRKQDDDLKRIQQTIGTNRNAWKMWTDAVSGGRSEQERMLRAMIQSGELHLHGANTAEKQAQALRILTDTSQYYETALANQNMAVTGNTGLLGTFRDQIRESGLAVDTLNNEVGNGVSKQNELTGAITSASAAVNTQGQSVDNLKAQFDAAKQAGDDLKTAFDAIFGSSMSMVEAEINARAQVDGVKKSFEDANATSDQHVTAILGAVKSYNELSQATVTQTGDAEGAQAAWQMNVAALVKQAEAAGASQSEIAQLARALNLPESVITAIQTPGANAAKILMENLGTVVDQIPKNPKITASADTSQAVGALGAVNTALKGVQTAWDAFWGTGTGAVGPVGPSGAGLPNVPRPPTGGGNTTSNTNITVNVSGGNLVGQQVVDALVAWQRRNGTIPVTTRRP